MGIQRQHYELQLTCYLKITNADVVVKKYEYMNYNIYRKVGGGEFFLYILLCQYEGGKRPYFLRAGIANFFFSLLENTTESV